MRVSELDLVKSYKTLNDNKNSSYFKVELSTSDKSK